MEVLVTTAPYVVAGQRGAFKKQLTALAGYLHIQMMAFERNDFQACVCDKHKASMSVQQDTFSLITVFSVIWVCIFGYQIVLLLEIDGLRLCVRMEMHDEGCTVISPIPLLQVELRQNS